MANGQVEPLWAPSRGDVSGVASGAMSASGDPSNGGDPASLERVSGTVKWFDATRGFGFIASDSGVGDVLLHFSVLREIGRRSLPEGTRVECLVTRRERGLQARRVLSFDLS